VEERADADRGSGDLHERSSVNGVFHASSLEAAGRWNGAARLRFCLSECACHREASLAIGTPVAFAGRLGSCEGAALNQVCPSSGR
jgi:hypothetical protein